MKSGIEFSSWAIKDEFKTEIVKATEETYSKTTTEKTTFSCGSEAKYKEAVGMWGWVTSNSSGDV